MRCRPRPPAGILLAAVLSLATAGAARAAQPAQAPALGAALADTAAARPGEEPYRLHADRLEGSATSEENVYTAIRATVQHGATTVTGDSARIYRGRELVLFRGNVKIVDGSTLMLGDEASYDRKRRLATLRGNVRIFEHGSRITGREARFYRDENRSEIFGSPVMEDSTRTLKADRIEYDRGRDMVTAIGNVNAVDRAESTRIQAGRVRYDRRLNYAWAEDDPRLTLDEADGKSTLVRSTKFEMDNQKRRVYALGHVQVEREKLRATGDRAEFYQAENRALLLGKPRAWDDEGRVQGDTLELSFAGNRVQTMQVRPNAVVDYESRADSTGRGERTHATGDTVTLYIDGDAARRAWVIGHARSEYWPGAADSAQGGRNVSTGDSILVEFDSGKPQRATVFGRSEGTYFMAAEGDTTAAGRRERVTYRGDRIIYDVKLGTVDVVHHGQVGYKEMNLTADRVRFNSRTQRMRAEGKPVLQDGKDRIVGITMTYDLNRRQGTVYEGRTAYERGFYYGDQIRRVSENVLAVRNGSYTTCDATPPHFHFGSNKMKIFLRDKVVARPVVFYIKRIPVFALPFYVFPIKPGRHSGFQLPQVEFGSGSATGKFIRNLGYYWAISDYLDATAWGDYYPQDRWVAHGQTRYHKRYRYQGQFNGSFQRQFSSQPGGPAAKQWDLAGTHFQTLGPRFTLTAQGTFVSSGSYFNDRFTGRSLAIRVQRNLHSSLSLQKSWSGASFETNLVRDQDLDPDPLGARLTQQLPRVAFSLTARPIGHPARGREPARLAWLASTVWGLRSSLVSQRITTMRAHPDTDSVTTVTAAGDTTRSVRVVLRDSVTTVRTAARHDLTLTDTRTLLGFLRVSPGMTYSEVFYSRDAAGSLNQRAGVWSGTLGANTAAFGTFRPGIGPLRAIRHVITPSVSFRYQPSYPRLRFGGIRGDSLARFTGVSGIGLDASEVRSLGFSLRNDIHVKWGDRANPRVINNLIQLTSSGAYDLLAQRNADRAARRAGVAPRRVRAISNIASTLILRPLERSEFDFNFLHNPTDGKLLRMDVSSGLSLTGRTKEGTAEEEAAVEPGTEALQAQSAIWAPQGLVPSGLPWQFSLAVSYSGFADPIPGGTYRRWASSTRANGSLGINPSKNWRVDYSYQYDLHTRQMISQNYNVKRDLHCWEMQFTRSISGGQTEYYFKINVKNLPEVYYEQGSRGLRGFGGMTNMY